MFPLFHSSAAFPIEDYEQPDINIVATMCGLTHPLATGLNAVVQISLIRGILSQSSCGFPGSLLS